MASPADDSLQQALKINRGYKLRYAHRISNELNTTLSHYTDGIDAVTDLTSEITLLRHFVGDELEALEVAQGLPTETAKQCTDKLNAVSFARHQVAVAIDRVTEACLKMAKIQNRGHVDALIMSNLAANVAYAMEAGLSEFAPQMQRVGLDVSVVCDHIGGLVSAAINGTVQSNNGVSSSGGISNQPTTMTADDLIRAMMQTVPSQAESA